jgi:hypothetical protein
LAARLPATNHSATTVIKLYIGLVCWAQFRWPVQIQASHEHESLNCCSHSLSSSLLHKAESWSPALLLPVAALDFYIAHSPDHSFGQSFPAHGYLPAHALPLTRACSHCSDVPVSDRVSLVLTVPSAWSILHTLAAPPWVPGMGFHGYYASTVIDLGTGQL